jgi:hypothetical protein
MLCCIILAFLSHDSRIVTKICRRSYGLVIFTVYLIILAACIVCLSRAPFFHNALTR